MNAATPLAKEVSSGIHGELQFETARLHLLLASTKRNYRNAQHVAHRLNNITQLCARAYQTGLDAIGRMSPGAQRGGLGSNA